MAKRIGKYKMSKREIALSAVDGATIQGSLDGIDNLTATGTSTLTTAAITTANVSGVTTLSGTMASSEDAQLKIINPVSGSASAITVSEATHAGRTVMIPQGLASLVTHVMPLPTEGVKYHFVYVGAAVHNEDIEFSADASGADFEGAITHIDVGDDTDLDQAIVYCAPDEDVIDLKVPGAFDLTFIGKNATTYYVYGNVTGVTPPTCS